MKWRLNILSKALLAYFAKQKIMCVRMQELAMNIMAIQIAFQTKSNKTKQKKYHAAV